MLDTFICSPLVDWLCAWLLHVEHAFSDRRLSMTVYGCVRFDRPPFDFALQSTLPWNRLIGIVVYGIGIAATRGIVTLGFEVVSINKLNVHFRRFSVSRCYTLHWLHFCFCLFASPLPPVYWEAFDSSSSEEFRSFFSVPSCENLWLELWNLNTHEKWARKASLAFVYVKDFFRFFLILFRSSLNFATVQKFYMVRSRENFGIMQWNDCSGVNGNPLQKNNERVERKSL